MVRVGYVMGRVRVDREVVVRFWRVLRVMLRSFNVILEMKGNILSFGRMW